MVRIFEVPSEDSVLVQTDVKSRLIGRLLTVASIYCAATDSSSASVSKTIFGRAGHISDLQAGARDLSTGTFERALSWFSKHWPEGADWPHDIARPVAEPAE